LLDILLRLHTTHGGQYLEWQTTRDFSSKYSDSRATKYAKCTNMTINKKLHGPVFMVMIAVKMMFVYWNFWGEAKKKLGAILACHRCDCLLERK